MRICLMVFALLLTARAAYAEPDVLESIQDSDGSRYYLEHLLTPQNTSFIAAPDKGGSQVYRFGRNQIEVFVDTADFPEQVVTPNRHVVLHMRPNDDATCQALADKIWAMLQLHRGAVPVIIDLTPYSIKTSDKTLTIKLRKPTVFFKMTDGKCVVEN